VLAHAWVAGGRNDAERADSARQQASGSERDISVGGIGYAPASLFDGFGYVALAIMIFGRWRPYGALGAALLFGFTVSLSATIGVFQQQIYIPGAFIEALPYFVTIVVVSGLVGRIRPPAADGVPFARS